MTTIRALINGRQRPDTAAAIAERAKLRKINEQGYRETQAKFPQITAENFAEALAYQARRIRELMQEAGLG